MVCTIEFLSVPRALTSCAHALCHLSILVSKHKDKIEAVRPERNWRPAQLAPSATIAEMPRCLDCIVVLACFGLVCTIYLYTHIYLGTP